MRRSRIAVLVLLFLPGCGGPGVAETTIELKEFSVSPAEDYLRAGIVDLSISNSGDFPHTLVVSSSSGTVVAGTSLIPPGGASSLSIELEPGAYTFTCRIVGESSSGEIIDHYQRGMVARVDVRA
jgi:hypothetical protein